jgi:hypothetical protein
MDPMNTAYNWSQVNHPGTGKISENIPNHLKCTIL